MLQKSAQTWWNAARRLIVAALGTNQPEDVTPRPPPHTLPAPMCFLLFKSEFFLHMDFFCIKTRIGHSGEQADRPATPGPPSPSREWGKGRGGQFSPATAPQVTAGSAASCHLSACAVQCQQSSILSPRVSLPTWARGTEGSLPWTPHCHSSEQKAHTQNN